MLAAVVYYRLHIADFYTKHLRIYTYTHSHKMKTRRIVDIYRYTDSRLIKCIYIERSCSNAPAPLYYMTVRCARHTHTRPLQIDSSIHERAVNNISPFTFASLPCARAPGIQMNFASELRGAFFGLAQTLRIFRSFVRIIYPRYTIWRYLFVGFLFLLRSEFSSQSKCDSD